MTERLYGNCTRKAKDKLRDELQFVLKVAQDLPPEGLPKLLGEIEEIRCTTMARLNSKSGMDLGLHGKDKLRGYILLATGHDGLLQTVGMPTRTTEYVELVGLCVSGLRTTGMPHRRDYRRFGASHRAGGTYPAPQPRTRPTKADEPRSGCTVRRTGRRVGGEPGSVELPATRVWMVRGFVPGDQRFNKPQYRSI